MSSETKLAYTVHHRGRRYRAGMTADEIGPRAGEFGDHVWEGGKAPAKSAVPSEGSPDGGSYTASPGVTRSALPGPVDTLTGADADPRTAASGTASEETGDGGGAVEETGDGGGAVEETGDGGTSTPPARKAAPARRSSTGS